MTVWVAPASEVVFSISPAKPPSDSDKVHPLFLPNKQVLKTPSITYKSTQSTHDGAELEGSATAPAKIDESDCASLLETTFGGAEHLTSTFSMKSGFFFTGSVQPPVENALVTVFADSAVVHSPPLEISSKMTELFSEQELHTISSKSGFSLATRALTDAQGAFRIGPFYFERQTQTPNTLLTVTIQKPGYEFAQKSASDWLNFKATKLALVEIRVVSEESKNPLPSKSR